VRDLRNILLAPTATLRQAVTAIDGADAKIVIVRDECGALVGTVTDGDVRRGLLRGLALDATVAEVMNRRPITAPAGTGWERAHALMRQHAVRQLPLLDDAGQVVELMLFEKEPVDGVWIVLMAGGEGRRLQPLTDDTPKPLLPVGGKPLIESLVRRFADQGFRHIFLSVNYRAAQFHAHFGNGSAFGVRIEYLIEAEPRGTAGSLSALPGTAHPIIVMNGDVLTSVDFRHLLAFHSEQRASATMCVREYAFRVPYGVVELDGQSLRSIIEKPNQSFFVNAGIYVLSPEAIARIPPHGRYDMTTLFERLIVEMDRVAVFPLREYWVDVGRMADLERARNEYASIFG
jgi:dTDP-glucose pyrophosphorylase/CBS domain-containing protein